MFKKLIKRLKSDTPTHFKRVIRICVVLGSVGTAIEVSGDKMPVPLQKIGYYMVVAGVIGAGVSSTAVQDKVPPIEE